MKKAAAVIVNAAVVQDNDWPQRGETIRLHQVLGNPTDQTAKDESSKMTDRLPVLGRTALGGLNSAYLSHRNQHLKNRTHRWHVIVASLPFLRSLIKLSSSILSSWQIRILDGASTSPDSGKTPQIRVSKLKQTVVKPMFPVLSQDSIAKTDAKEGIPPENLSGISTNFIQLGCAWNPAGWWWGYHWYQVFDGDAGFNHFQEDKPNRGLCVEMDRLCCPSCYAWSTNGRCASESFRQIHRDHRLIIDAKENGIDTFMKYVETSGSQEEMPYYWICVVPLCFFFTPEIGCISTRNEPTLQVDTLLPWYWTLRCSRFNLPWTNSWSSLVPRMFSELLKHPCQTVLPLRFSGYQVKECYGSTAIFKATCPATNERR